MKKLGLTLVAAIMMAIPMTAQQAPSSSDDVVTIDHRVRAYREGEVLVKFKTESGVQMRHKAGRFATAGVSAIDQVMNALGATNVEQLMPRTGKLDAPRRVRAIDGSEVELKDMRHLYRVRFDAAKVQGVEAAIEQLKALDEVEFAEPNYLVYALSSGESESMSFEDPFFNNLWGPQAINLNRLWAKPIIDDKRPVIAILDTGVDTEHPDLVDNLWTNEAELNGSEGNDDDGNGCVDDLHGYDFVNQTGHVRDFNGHGTHCAGIAAAVGNNGIGIVGANPDALIMAIAVMQSDGVGDVATIIKGIDYAAANGADLISMSFGGYAYSIAQEQALARAYASTILVAAAGNDAKCIYPHLCAHPTTGDKTVGSPMFPAAFTFVLGVESSGVGNVLASFSNFDHDGPITFNSDYFSEEQMYNYELRAPGVGIYSTYPGGKYKSLSGTSMACPLAAGAISRLIQTKEYASKEILFGDLIQSRGGVGNIDMLAAYNYSDKDRRPSLELVTYLLDDAEGGDGDNRPDAGETIDLYPTLRNAWGMAENIKVSLEMGELEDASLVEFITNDVDFGQTLSSYAKAKSVSPIRIKIADGCVDGRHIKLRLRATCDNIASELVYDFTITVENGVEIGGMIETDTTLEPNVHYIVTRTLVVPEGVTLTILPGTVLRFKDGTGIAVAEKAFWVADGTAEQPITFTNAGLESYPKVEFSFPMEISTAGYDRIISYAIFENLEISIIAKNNTDINKFYINNSIIKNCKSSPINIWSIFPIYYSQSLFYNIIFKEYPDFTSDKYGHLNLCNIIGNNLLSELYYLQSRSDRYGFLRSMFATANNIVGNLDTEGMIYTLYGSTSPVIEKTETPSYFGSAREDIVRRGVWDIEQGVGSMKYDLSNMLTRPNPDAPGILWKVVVNGYDAQDEFEMLPPLGVGRHQFDIYYSHPQDKSWEPTIAMGVRPPYTQTSIAEEGSWNEAGDVYTAYLTITGKMAIDGLNRIYVSSGKNADKFFDIPLENTRFNVLVSAAGSMSTGFEATAGLGKVSLEWETQDENVDDILGYNLYRYQTDEAGAATDTTRINEMLLDETTFTDYDVVPGETYNYYYKIMRTSLTENSPSHVVAATPLTASKGDANGSLTIDVADVVTEIGYMTNQNPQPFIFEAADVNSDATVNILDVVGTINLIIHPEMQGAAAIDEECAKYYIEEGILYMETPVAIGGVQIELYGTADVEVMDALIGFENVKQPMEDGAYLFLAYSMSGKSLSAGKHALLRIGDAAVTNVVLSNTRGQNIVAIADNKPNALNDAKMEIGTIAPNPFSSEVTIPYAIGESGAHSVRLVFTDLAGRVVDSYATTAEYGNHSYTWKPVGVAQSGIFFVTLYVDEMAVQSNKLIRVK